MDRHSALFARWVQAVCDRLEQQLGWETTHLVGDMPLRLRGRKREGLAGRQSTLMTPTQEPTVRAGSSAALRCSVPEGSRRTRPRMAGISLRELPMLGAQTCAARRIARGDSHPSCPCAARRRQRAAAGAGLRLGQHRVVRSARTPLLVALAAGGTRRGRFLWRREAQRRGRRAPARFVD